MTQFQHNLVAGVILIVLWNLFIKDYFYDEEEYRNAENFVKKLFDKMFF